MLFSKRQKAGYVKIEDSHFALLKQNSKDQWEYKTVFVKPGINETWKALVREIRHFFPKNTRLNFIFSGNSGFTVQYFPAQSEPAEIKNSIELNSRTVFGTDQEVSFKLRIASLGTSLQRKVSVAFIPKHIIDKIKVAGKESGYKINKITTMAETAIASLKRQKQKSTSSADLILYQGYNRLIILAVLKGEIISSCSIITGSSKDMISDLSAMIEIKPEELEQVMTEAAENDGPIKDIILQNRQNLLTHINMTLTELRNDNLLDENTTIYSSFDMVPQMPFRELLTERLGPKVEKLSGKAFAKNISEKEKWEDTSDRYNWLLGAQYQEATDFSNIRASKIHFDNRISQVVIVLLILAVLIAPYYIINARYNAAETELDMLTRNLQNVELLLEKANEVAAKSDKTNRTLSHLEPGVYNRGKLTEAVRHISECLPPLARLKRLSYNQSAKKFSITAHTSDPETALRYFDELKKSSLLRDTIITSLNEKPIMTEAEIQTTANFGDMP